MLDFVVIVFRLLVATASFCQAGLLFLSLFPTWNFSLVEGFSLIFGLGTGLITLEMLLLSLLGVPLTLWSIGLPWGAAWGIFLVALVRRNHWGAVNWRTRWMAKVSAAQRRPNLLDGVLLATLIAIVGVVVFRGAFHPVFEWDGWAIWDLKARAFYHDRSIFPFVNDAYYLLSHLEYPNLFPLAGTFVYLVLGQVADGVTFLPALFYAATLAAVYSALRRYGSQRTLALALTLGFAVIPNILFWSQQFYAEIPFLYYLLASSLCLFLYLREPQWNWLVIAAVLAGFAAQTKVEGILMTLPPAAVMAIQASLSKETTLRSVRWKATGSYVLIIALIYSPWFIFRYVGHPMALGSFWAQGAQVSQQWGGLPTVLATVAKWMLQPTYQYLSFLLYPLTALLVGMNWRRYQDWAFAYQLFYSLLLLVPSLMLFLIQPVWLEFDRLGRYLVNFTGACYVLAAFQVVDLFRAFQPPTKRVLSRWMIFLQQVVVGGVVLVSGLDLAFDLWREHWPPAPFTSRPVGLVRQVYQEALEMLPLGSAERQEVVNIRFSRRDDYQLLQLALSTTPKTEDVALWAPANRVDGYLLWKGAYLIYPRKMRLVNEPVKPAETLRPPAGIGTVIVYDQEHALDQPGYMIYQPSPRFAVVRLNGSSVSPNQGLGYIEAPIAFAEGIHLNGYQIVSPLLDGDTNLLLSWETVQPVTRSYKVFVHIFSGDELVAQHDSIPVLGTYPTSVWKPGNILLDAHPVVLPKSARQDFKFCVGLYDPANLDRLMIERAEGYEVGIGIACRPMFK